ncbi:MAG: hypothetical protein LBQ57_08270, partial [Spirochaetales bacterium]|nr:hypothetical protein [Spirochaetales bacterium]
EFGPGVYKCYGPSKKGARKKKLHPDVMPDYNLHIVTVKLYNPCLMIKKGMVHQPLSGAANHKTCPETRWGSSQLYG